jgi:hypothetical protein
MTAAASHAELLDAVADDVQSLCAVIQGLFVHVFWAEQYGVHAAEERKGELELRTAAQKLDCIVARDSRPLSLARTPEERVVANCRDFSLLLTTMLRHKGVPARARCGFARYFIPDHFEDHWVCEYWNPHLGRWVLVDAQLDALQMAKLSIGFDPLDVPREEFLSAGAAWRMCRDGSANPDAFGIGELHGLWFVRGNLVRDVASLNKMELLPWDVWGLCDLPDDNLSRGDLVALDDMAELTHGDVAQFDLVRTLYENDDRWHVPAVIRSYSASGFRTVELDTQ